MRRGVVIVGTRRTSAAAKRGNRARRGFTLIEVLAALLLMAIVLPSVMRGISTATQAAAAARHRTEAAGLAQAELAQIVASQQWQNGNLSGDFGAAWPGYSWKATVSAWQQDNTDENIDEIDLEVQWMDRNRPDSVTFSTLAYPRVQQ